MSFLLDTATIKEEAIIRAFHIARENGIAGYAIECADGGWLASACKPLLRYRKIIECQINGKEYCA